VIHIGRTLRLRRLRQRSEHQHGCENDCASNIDKFHILTPEVDKPKNLNGLEGTPKESKSQKKVENSKLLFMAFKSRRGDSLWRRAWTTEKFQE
jgi:hypothetical protein